jgi:hypothetical protein
MSGVPVPMGEPAMGGGALIARRTALTVSAAGVSSLLLPSAAAAASELSFTPTAFTYGTKDQPVAGWLPFDAADPDAYGTNYLPGVAARTIATDLVAHLTLAGTTISATSLTTDLKDPEVRGASGQAAPEPSQDDQNEPVESTAGHSTWHMRNSRSRSDTIALADPPHLRFSITVDAGTLSLSTLVLHAVRNVTPAETAEDPPPPLNLAAYVSAPGVAGGALLLRRTMSLVTDDAHHVVINLGLQDVTFATGATITVRLYPFEMSTAREVRFERFNPEAEPIPLTDLDVVRTGGTSEGLDVNVNAKLIDRGNWMAAFIGTYDPPPESQGSDGPEEAED